MKKYGDPEFGAEEWKNENRKTIAAALKAGHRRFDYTYNFGDGWEHVILIEKRLPKAALDKTTATPACIDGARACQPEDCGGPFGYAPLLNALQDPTASNRAARLDRIEEGFDPEAFSVTEANAAYRAAPSSRRE